MDTVAVPGARDTGGVSHDAVVDLSAPVVDLSGCGLDSLPPELLRNTGLLELHLSDNRLRVIPQWIGRLASLRELDLSDNGITELPEDVDAASNSKSLYVMGRGPVEFESQAGRLPALRLLNLSDNRLTSLPPWLAGLTRLSALHLADNRLTGDWSVVGRLLALKSLRVSANKLDVLPEHVGNVTTLTTLDLSVNRLVELPQSLARLVNLQELNLAGNNLAALPGWISRLTRLQRLNLDDNNLTDLPREIAPLLRKGLVLSLSGNPLRDPLPDLIARGADALASYLLSLEDAVPHYEAKVMLVGEGNVGKTSLVASLSNEPFVPGRDTTHGIEIHPLSMRHPRLPVDMTIRSWDFGGQEVYRITHQFFFSRRSLYLLVWNPREGQEQNEVDGWLRRIRLRVGQDARVMVIATHCDERRPELDYPRLRREFESILVGNHAVDNSTGSGIHELRAAIADQAAQLPPMGQALSPRWIAARDEILASAEDEPQIPYERFVDTCERHGVVGDEVATLAELLHDLGQVIYYGDDDGLRDVVVLRPEWLTKAIGYVLEDLVTRDAGGVLDHARLKEIWQDRPGAVSYEPRYHPYFLRLMEKFDVSYRLDNEWRYSLVAQLVPHERADLPWDRDTGLPDGVRSLSLTCELAEAAPGLIAWLTVRHHRASTRTHWRSGVFLKHPIEGYASEALLELTSDRRLMIEVRAPSPDMFFNVLLDSVEDLVRQRWPGLAYHMFVPCPGRDGRRCVGQFRLDGLQRYRERGGVTQNCLECDSDHEISALLTGFGTAELSLRPVLERLHEGVDNLARGIGRVEQLAAESADSVRRLVKAVATEVADCPRLFTLAPGQRTGMRRMRITDDDFVLTLWCEHPGHWHPLDAATYRFQKPKDWLVSIAPYANLVLKVLRLVVPISDAVAGIVLSDEQRELASREVALMRTLLEAAPQEIGADGADIAATDSIAQLEPAQGQSLRQLRVLLFTLDDDRSFGGLRRVQASSGEFLWVCRLHYPQYDPGLPTIGG